MENIPVDIVVIQLTAAVHSAVEFLERFHQSSHTLVEEVLIHDPNCIHLTLHPEKKKKKNFVNFMKTLFLLIIFLYSPFFGQ